MKTIFVAVALLLFAASPASAQRGRGALTPEQIEHQKVETTNRWRLYLFNGVTLSDGQATKANEIIGRWIDADAALEHQRTPDDPVVMAYRAKKANLETRRNEELAAVLSASADKARFEKNAKTASSR